MYCTVRTLPMKRQPAPSGVYRQPRAKIVTIPLEQSPQTGYAVTLEGDGEIERQPMSKWVFILNKSERDGGKVVKKQWNICTITYWEFVGDYMRTVSKEIVPLTVLDYYYIVGQVKTFFNPPGVVDCFIKKGIDRHFPKTWDQSCLDGLKGVKLKAAQEKLRADKDEYRRQYDEIFKLIQSKAREIADEVVSTYKSSDEFAHYIEGIKLLAKPIEQLVKEDNANRKDAKKREHERKELGREERFEYARKMARGAASHEDDNAITPSQIKRVQRELARKFHPDLTGGSDDAMKAINTMAEMLLKS